MGAVHGASAGTHVSGGVGAQQGEADEVLLSACLGNTWAHCVNTRLVVQFPANSDGSCTAYGGGSGALGDGAFSPFVERPVAGELRRLRVAKAPCCSEASFDFVISPAGPRSVLSAIDPAASLLRF